MPQDIRELFKNDSGLPRESLMKGHESRFETKLDQNFGPAAKSFGDNYLWMKIAAVLVIIVAVGGLFFGDRLSTGGEEQAMPVVATSEPAPIQLSDLSPEFRKVEDYYMASINVELAQLKVDEDNKELVDSFLMQLEDLNEEYQRLNKDLLESGVNDQTVNALIENLQLRLDLLFKLKEKLNELKEFRQGEMESNTL